MAETTQPTLEEMREAVRKADEAEAAKAAAEAEKANKPYVDFTTSNCFADTLAKAEELRTAYVGSDERKFTMLNSLVSIMKRM